MMAEWTLTGFDFLLIGLAITTWAVMGICAEVIVKAIRETRQK